MGVFVEDEVLVVLDGVLGVDLCCVCWLFGDNCGFIMVEFVQFVVLMDDILVLELGVDIFGVVLDVFVYVDGVKKLILFFGIGNYLILVCSVNLVCQLFGEDVLCWCSYVYVYGIGMLQNWVIEFYVFNQVVEVFGICDWLVVVIKVYVGYFLGSVGGDQLVVVLGIFVDGVLFGIVMVECFVDDLYVDWLFL